MTHEHQPDDENITRIALRSSDAIGELLCVCLLGLLPLLVFCIGSATEGKEFLAAASKFFEPIGTGQLYLYLFSLTGSLVWIFFEQIKIYSKFWLGIYSLWLLAPPFIAMFAYGANPNMGSPMASILIGLSIILYLVYVWLYYSLRTHIPKRAGKIEDRMNESAENTAKSAKEFIG